MNVGEIIKQKIMEDEARKESALNRAKKAFDNGATIVVPNKYFTDVFHKVTKKWPEVERSVKENGYEYMID